MPVAMLERVRCDDCGHHYQRGGMSPIQGVCAECFEQHHTICEDCGLALRAAYSEVCGNRNGEPPYCCECWEIRRLRGNLVSRWRPRPLDISFATYERLGSTRKFGVEVETSCCRNYENVRNLTKFGCKVDCSISGREFDSPVLYGDEGFVEIENLLAYGKENNWRADLACGCHTHYDMRDEPQEELFRIAYAYAKTYEFWAKCVSEYRRADTHCHCPSYSACDVRAAAEAGQRFRSFARSTDRYDYVNLGAYNCYKTFEVRLLEGTVDAETICNWVAIHARFIDYVKCLSLDDLNALLIGNVEQVFMALASIVHERDLNLWLTGRINEFSPGLLH